MTDDRFSHPTYLIRRKVLKLFGGAFHVYDPGGGLCFYSKMKAFKLREDIRLYTGEDMQEEVLLIQALQIIDFSAAYTVIDSGTGQKVGTLKRRGWKSLFRDEWIIMDAQDGEIGAIREENIVLALIRRFLTNLVPQKFEATVGGARVCRYRQNFNPFVLKLTADFTPDAQGVYDRRLGLAAGILLAAIEGRQN